jgi:hypothetical protein
MSVELQVIDFPVMSQGWWGTIEANIKNTGTENVENVYLKVVDPGMVVFSSINVYYDLTHNVSCRNAFSSQTIHNFDDNNKKFPAGSTKQIKFSVVIQDDAPVAIHTLSTFFKYAVYV